MRACYFFNLNFLHLPGRGVESGIEQWAVGCGLMEGDGVSLTPASNATRCQSAALFMRFLEEIMK